MLRRVGGESGWGWWAADAATQPGIVEAWQPRGDTELELNETRLHVWCTTVDGQSDALWCLVVVWLVVPSLRWHEGARS